MPTPTQQAYIYVYVQLLYMATALVSMIDSSSYMPLSHVVLIVAIAFVALALTKYLEDIEVPLALMSTLAFGIAAWFSPYISTTSAFFDGTTVTYAQLVSPNPTLQIFLAVCTLFAFVYTLYLLFLRQADGVVDKKSIR